MTETILKLNGAVPQESSVKEELKIKIATTSLFDITGMSYVHCLKIYYAYFEEMPNLISFNRCIHHPEKALEWVDENYKDKILKRHFRQDYFEYKQKIDFIDVIYILEDGIMIDIETNGTIVILFAKNGEAQAKSIANEFQRFTIKKKKDMHKISIVIQRGPGVDLMDLENKKPKVIMAQNYNDDLVEMHKKIVKDINRKNDSGLFLFHGTPGTGKSTYIRYLIHCTKKKVIFMTPKLAGNLDTPQLLNLLLENRNSILVIEDAEDLLQSRDQGMNPYISMLLNLTDGLLGGNLGIKIICTFNGNFNKIDSALLRKGRLIAKYEFKALSIAKAQSLSDSLGFKTTITKEMTLAEIYNQNEEDFGGKGDRKRIGF